MTVRICSFWLWHINIWPNFSSINDSFSWETNKMIISASLYYPSYINSNPIFFNRWWHIYLALDQNQIIVGKIYAIISNTRETLLWDTGLGVGGTLICLNLLCYSIVTNFVNYMHIPQSPMNRSWFIFQLPSKKCNVINIGPWEVSQYFQICDYKHYVVSDILNSFCLVHS